MDVNAYNDELAKYGGYKPPSATELALVEAAVLRLFNANSKVPHGELDSAMAQIGARGVTVVAVKMMLHVVHHSDGYYYLDQR